MPYPNQTFNTISDLLAYVNTNVVTNGNQEITAIIENNVENGLANFIVSYTLNSGLAGISSSTGVVPLSKPITYFSVTPTSISLGTNVQNEFYIINATANNIPLTSGYSYIDAYQTVQTSIPARAYVHLAKATNGTWLQVNTATAGSDSLPPQTGKSGQVLTTNGTSTNWVSPIIPITSADFESDGVTYINTDIPETQYKYAIFWNDLSRFIYEGTEWNYVANGGFEVIIPGFDANSQNYNLFLFLYGLNS
jgi:hypothetical protein